MNESVVMLQQSQHQRHHHHFSNHHKNHCVPIAKSPNHPQDNNYLSSVGGKDNISNVSGGVQNVDVLLNSQSGNDPSHQQHAPPQSLDELTVDHDDNESGFYDVPWEHQQQQLLLHLQRQHSSQAHSPNPDPAHMCTSVSSYCWSESPAIPFLRPPSTQDNPPGHTSGTGKSASVSSPSPVLKSPTRGSVPTKALLPPLTEPVTCVDLAAIRLKPVGAAGMGNTAAGAAARFRANQANKRNQVTLDKNSSMVNGAGFQPPIPEFQLHQSESTTGSTLPRDSELFVATNAAQELSGSGHNFSELPEVVAKLDVLNGSTDSGTGSELKVSPAPHVGGLQARCSSTSPSLAAVESEVTAPCHRNSHNVALQVCNSQQSLAITSTTKNVFLRELQKRPPCGVRAKNLVKDRRKEGNENDSSQISRYNSVVGTDGEHEQVASGVCNCCDTATTSASPVPVCGATNGHDYPPHRLSDGPGGYAKSVDSGSITNGQQRCPKVLSSANCCELSSGFYENGPFVTTRPPMYSSSHAALPTMGDFGVPYPSGKQAGITGRHRLASSHDDLSRLTVSISDPVPGVTTCRAPNSGTTIGGKTNCCDKDDADGVIWERRSGPPPPVRAKSKNSGDNRPASEYDVPWDAIDLAIALRHQKQICQSRGQPQETPTCLRTRAISGDRGFASGGDSLSSSGDDGTLDSTYHANYCNKNTLPGGGRKTSQLCSRAFRENGIDCTSPHCSSLSKAHLHPHHLPSDSSRSTSALGKRIGQESFSKRLITDKSSGPISNGHSNQVVPTDRSVLFSPHPHRAAIVIPSSSKLSGASFRSGHAGSRGNVSSPLQKHHDRSFCSGSTKRQVDKSTSVKECCSPQLMSVHDIDRVRPAVTSSAFPTRVSQQTSNSAGYKREHLRDSRKMASTPTVSKKDDYSQQIRTSPNFPDSSCAVATPVMETAFCIHPRPGQSTSRFSPISMDEERERLIQELCHRQDSSRSASQPPSRVVTSPVPPTDAARDYNNTVASPPLLGSSSGSAGANKTQSDAPLGGAVRLRRTVCSPESPVPTTSRKPFQRKTVSSPVPPVAGEVLPDRTGSNNGDLSVSKSLPTSNRQTSAKMCLPHTPNSSCSSASSWRKSQPFPVHGASDHGTTCCVDSLPTYPNNTSAIVSEPCAANSNIQQYCSGSYEFSDNNNSYDFPPSSLPLKDSGSNCCYDNCSPGVETTKTDGLSKEIRSNGHAHQPVSSLQPGSTRCSFSSHGTLPITDVLASMTNGITPPPPTANSPPMASVATHKPAPAVNHTSAVASQSPRNWFGKRFKTNSTFTGIGSTGKSACSSSENRLSPDSIGPPIRIPLATDTNTSPLCAENWMMDCRSPVRHIDSTLSDSSLGVCGFVGGLNKGLVDDEMKSGSHQTRFNSRSGDEADRLQSSYRKLSASHNSIASISAATPTVTDNGALARDRSLDRAFLGSGKHPPPDDLEYDVPWEFCNPDKVNRLIACSNVEERKSLKSMQKFSPKGRNAKFSKLDRGNLSLNFGCAGLNPVAEKIDPNVALETQCWYHGAISRAEAEQRLRSFKEGSYLVRVCESNIKEYALSLKSAKGFMHMKMQRNEEVKWILGYFSQPFPSIPRMIKYYSVNKLPIKGAEHMCLLYPVQDQLL